eukprot:TRINITY_DN5528_c1_g1_i1.p1 TRINITY_DN5528_c1_g1~~TRINITY_DN5528_c1_g1_i1.p1  ORF type:complete len:788 (+),score=99.90 TRINITY_DN5528_c1_g1_i1:46-2364(+)
MDPFGLSDDEAETRLQVLRKWVAQPIPTLPWTDPEPAFIGGHILIGSKHHASNVELLVSLGVTAVLNCASAGISRLPIDEFKDKGIRYAFTNIQDHHHYPILHDKKGICSKHFQDARTLHSEVKEAGGKVLFFCVAGQNRSAALAIACRLLDGEPLEDVLMLCAKQRSFILENIGFQRQIVELESVLNQLSESTSEHASKRLKTNNGDYLNVCIPRTVSFSTQSLQRSSSPEATPSVEVELLVPGLCTMDVRIPKESSIAEVKRILIDHVDRHLLAYSEKPAYVSKSWVVLAMFGYDDMYDLPLEEEAIGFNVLVARIRSMFGLNVVENGVNSIVTWNEKCRFALVIFAVVKNKEDAVEEPWFFRHEERPGAPATLLKNSLRSTHLRSWDFGSGQPYSSKQPIVFSFGEGTKDKKAFMKVSRSDAVPQQFNVPGEGGILGMGANAIVHRVEMAPILDGNGATSVKDIPDEQCLDTAVKRWFTLGKMLASLEKTSEAGMAKRLRLANSLNSDGRVQFFYGLGVALASNNKNHEEYKFETTLLARYQEEFSSYTMKKFMDDYTTVLTDAPDDARPALERLQSEFTVMKVKVLLVSLLSGFRDLTLMGVQSFDFNHLNNVLVSRDYRMVRLIDIDGNSKGSLAFPSEQPAQPSPEEGSDQLHYSKPALDIDLHLILPMVVHRLILGKGRGVAFVNRTISQIWQAKTDDAAKAIIQDVIRENFYPVRKPGSDAAVCKHISKMAEWFYALVKKHVPWSNWTRDIYDAMRCIDHLPIS